MFKKEKEKEERRETLMDLKFKTTDLTEKRDTIFDAPLEELKEEKPKKTMSKTKKFFKILKKNKRVQIALCIALVLVILIAFLIAKGIGLIIYHSTDEYKLIKMGYDETEANVILTSVDEGELKAILKHEYNGTIDNFVSESNFMFSELDRYLEYQKANPTEAYSLIITKINTNRDREFYSDITQADTSLNEKMLVNKYYCLSENYEPAVLKDIPLSYCYGELKMDSAALEYFEAMCDQARVEGHTIVAEVAYRTYAWQSEIWNEYKDSYGIEYADEVAARAGSSEHQTGLSVNVVEYNNSSRFDKTGSYQWMMNHAHEYGFIQRYPEGLEDITGFEFEPGHFRFVGVQVATDMYNKNITFDEYYALNIEVESFAE